MLQRFSYSCTERMPYIHREAKLVAGQCAAGARAVHCKLIRMLPAIDDAEVQ